MSILVENPKPNGASILQWVTQKIGWAINVLEQEDEEAAVTKQCKRNEREKMLTAKQQKKNIS